MSSFEISRYFETKLSLLDEVTDDLNDAKRTLHLMSELRMDRNRMLVIILTRMMRRLIRCVEQSID